MSADHTSTSGGERCKHEWQPTELKFVRWEEREGAPDYYENPWLGVEVCVECGLLRIAAKDLWAFR